MATARDTYQLLLEGDLLELHLVDAGLGGASEGGRGDKRALHDGRRFGEIGQLEFKVCEARDKQRRCT